MELSIESADEFEREILNELGEFLEDKINDEMWDSNFLWTEKIKSVLTEIGKKKSSYKVATSGLVKDADMGEWLYDFTLYGNDLNDNITLRKVILVAEIEWGKEYDVQYDFEKLIQARSDYRLMIFQAKSFEGIKSILEKLVKIAEEFSHSQRGDRYMFAGWLNGENYKFHCSHYIIKKEQSK